MNSYIALLRGINVSGQKKIKMADLRDLFSELGFQNAITYIQSGNVVFESVTNDSTALQLQIEQGMMEKFGFDVEVIIRTRNELEKILQNVPFSQSGIDASELCVIFLKTKPAIVDESGLISPKSKDDKFKIRGNEIYLFAPGGYGRTYYNNNYFERKLKITATARNWNTVKKLHEIAATELPGVIK